MSALFTVLLTRYDASVSTNTRRDMARTGLQTIYMHRDKVPQSPSHSVEFSGIALQSPVPQARAGSAARLHGSVGGGGGAPSVGVGRAPKMGWKGRTRATLTRVAAVRVMHRGGASAVPEGGCAGCGAMSVVRLSSKAWGRWMRDGVV